MRGARCWTLMAVACPVLGYLSAVALAAPAPLVTARGADLTGGAADLYGRSKLGARRVNYAYAAPNDERSRLTWRFEGQAWPRGPLFVHVRGALDDFGTPCPLRVSLNGTVLFEGERAFPSNAWGWRAWAVPEGTLREGGNELEVANVSAEGKVGMPPWVMLAAVAIGDEDCDLTPAAAQDFVVRLPEQVRPLPEPLPEGAEPGFAIRGMKGWMWRPEQYLAEIPVMARHGMNFLMNCYGSMWDIEHHAWGEPEFNQWWEPLPEEKREAYAEVVRACQREGIEFCFSLNPNLASRRIVRYGNAEDLEALWQHYAWMQGLGVQWFNLQFDDISEGIDPGGQARLANALLERLRRRDPEAHMTVCGTYYWGTGQEPGAREYLEELGRALDPEVYVFWTGDAVVTPRITRRAAESYQRTVGHKLILWDNYPVNDGAPTLHLGPVTGRDAGLCQVVDGYMVNPLSPQNEANRIPLLTAADYAWNPAAYDPARSIGQAVAHLAETRAEQEALRDLVELYPGMLLFGQGTGWNPLAWRLEELLDQPHPHAVATAWVEHAQGVADRLERAAPGRWADARRTLRDNIETMRATLRETYGE